MTIRTRPAHGALFAAIRALPAPDPNRHAQDTSWLNAVLTEPASTPAD